MRREPWPSQADTRQYQRWPFATLKREVQVSTWNIEGLTEEKIISLTRIMSESRISITCIQETHNFLPDYFLTQQGSTGQNVERAGVGFIVAPWMRHCIVSFCQVSARMASLKIRVQGGKMALVSCYAPHSGYPLEDRVRFFSDLQAFTRNISVHGPKLILGDLNARIYRRLPGE